MKLLRDILYKSEILKTTGSLNFSIKEVCFDSRKAGNGDLFVAVRGTLTDGHLYIQKAVENGATAVVCEEIPEEISDTVVYIKVKNSSKALATIAANFYGSPSEKLKLIGVTGTNGKTTIVTLLHNLMMELGYPTALLSTIENKINKKIFPATHTTPDPLRINKMLHQSVESGCEFCFMEVSSHAVVQNRIHGLNFTGGVFTNITHDHLDYHNTFGEYLNAKKAFFDGLSRTSFALTNIDDKNGRVMIQNTPAKKFTYALSSPANFKGNLLENQFAGLHLKLNDKDLHSELIGRFNAYNLLAVYSTAMLVGIDEAELLTALSKLKPAEGRFERMASADGITGIVDYAHTPDALLNVLETINSIRKGNEKLITVIGAGGNRDKLKRPKMAKIAGAQSDLIILTSDNPRHEDPDSIIDDMKEGIEVPDKKKFITIPNREEAIKTACTMANPGDIVLVAGKGHEKYQEIEGVKHPFDDKEILRSYLNKAE